MFNFDGMVLIILDKGNVFMYTMLSECCRGLFECAVSNVLKGTLILITWTYSTDFNHPASLSQRECILAMEKHCFHSLSMVFRSSHFHLQNNRVPLEGGTNV
jgi:hypothetical protein